MRIKIKGKDMVLYNKDVAQAKKMVSNYILKVSKICEEQQYPTFYFTFLIIMHILSQQALDMFDEELLSKVMKALNENRN